VAVGGIGLGVKGTGVKVEVGIAVSVGTTLAAGAHAAKRKAIRKIVMMFLIFIKTLLCEELPNGVR
jgi:hypothetical protein